MPNPAHHLRSREQTGTPPVVLNLVIANLLVFVLQWIDQDDPQRGYGLMESWLGLWPIAASDAFQQYHPTFLPWQLVTYGFLHSTAGFAHIFFNMLILWMFGSAIERDFGSRRFLVYYLFCVVGAGITHLLVPHLFGLPETLVIGASGGTFGLLLAFGWRYPHHEIMLIFPPIPMKARTAVIVFGALELALGASRLHTGIAHFAHLGGLASGALILAFWRSKLPFKPKNRLP